jgi:general secretion pathway protein C
VELLFRKYLWALDLAVIALCAVFLGRASASLVEARLPSVPPPRPAARSYLSSTDKVYSKAYEETVTRNVFCSTCAPPVKATTEETKVDLTPVKTTLPLQVVSIAILPPRGLMTTSFCVLRDTDTKMSGAFGVGDKVKNATVTAIEEKRVYLDNAGKPEYVELIESSEEASSPAPSIAAAPPPPPPSAPPSDALSAELDRGIKKTGEHSYDIQRQTLESVLGNMSLLSRSARIVPEIREGRAAGFRLYSVRPDGPFAKIGMQNGDVISSINGLEITSPEKALEVYAKLKSASHLSLGLERNGQRITKDYSIR